MSQIKAWLTVKEAAFVVGRDASRIYAWLAAGKLDTQVDASGVTQVGHLSLMRAESEIRRGRPAKKRAS